MSKPVKSAVKWVQNQSHSLKKRSSTPNLHPGSGSLNGSWVHPPDALLYGRVDYTVRYLGHAEVDKPKGTEVIKEAIQKIKFQLQVKCSQGHKISRVELQINIDGVNIVDSRSRMVIYRYPLHKISFCADDKQDKRVFSFIAKQDATTHRCFVFLSDKLAEEITQTIGQAFDLAYRRFKETTGRDLEAKKQIVLLRKRIQDLESENADLKTVLAAFQRKVSAGGIQLPEQVDMSEIERMLGAGGLVPASKASQNGATTFSGQQMVQWQNFQHDHDSIPPPTDKAPPTPKSALPPPPAMKPPPIPGSGNHGVRNNELISLSENGPDVGRKLENLQLEGMDDIFDPDFDPRAGERRPDAKTDLFGLTPFSSEPENTGSLANGTGEHSYEKKFRKAEEEGSKEDLLRMLSKIDTRIAEAREMQEGFSAGLSMGTTENSQFDDLDPLSLKSDLTPN